MSISKIVSPRRTRGSFYELIDSTLDVSRPDRLSSAEITAIVQAAGLQGMDVPLVYERLGLNLYAAVRKNRYIILPVDFEEAWKVCYLSFVWSSHMTCKFTPEISFSSTSKRSNGQTTLTNSVRTINLFCVHPLLID